MSGLKVGSYYRNLKGELGCVVRDVPPSDVANMESLDQSLEYVEILGASGGWREKRTGLYYPYRNIANYGSHFVMEELDVNGNPIQTKNQKPAKLLKVGSYYRDHEGNLSKAVRLCTNEENNKFDNGKFKYMVMQGGGGGWRDISNGRCRDEQKNPHYKFNLIMTELDQDGYPVEQDSKMIENFKMPENAIPHTNEILHALANEPIQVKISEQWVSLFNDVPSAIIHMLENPTMVYRVQPKKVLRYFSVALVDGELRTSLYLECSEEDVESSLGGAKVNNVICIELDPDTMSVTEVRNLKP